MEETLEESLITLDLATWAFIGGTIVPILVGILTKCRASSAVKGLVNLVLSAIAGIIATAIATGGALNEATVVAAFMALIASVATYFGVLKPTGVTGAVQGSTANFGIGKPTNEGTATVSRT